MRRPCKPIGRRGASPGAFSGSYSAECNDNKSTKSQTPSTKEAPSSNIQTHRVTPLGFGDWDLLWDLEIGFWGFENMIQLSKNYTLPEREEEPMPMKIVGVGGAGANALDRIVLDGMEKTDLIAINTDVQSLASSVAAHKVQLGRAVTRGSIGRRSTSCSA